MRRACVTLSLGLAVVTATAHAYRGDGNFVDRGVLEAHHRYVLDFGALQVTTGQRRTFSLASLPSDEFTVGLEIASLDNSTIPIESLTALIHLRLENDRGEIVFDIRSLLSKWVLSSPSLTAEKGNGFLYVRGIEDQIPLSNGIFRLERRGVRSDGGWGTYFTPRRNGSYNLLFECDAPNAVPFAVRLVAYGAGWK